MKFRVKYRRARVAVEGERTGVCQACGAEGRTELHHWKYQYTTKEVRDGHALALDNTIELCFTCHKMADHIRNILEDQERFHQVMVALSYAVIKKMEGDLNGIDKGRGDRAGEAETREQEGDNAAPGSKQQSGA